MGFLDELYGWNVKRKRLEGEKYLWSGRRSERSGVLWQGEESLQREQADKRDDWSHDEGFNFETRAERRLYDRLSQHYDMTASDSDDAAYLAYNHVVKMRKKQRR